MPLISLLLLSMVMAAPIEHAPAPAASAVPQAGGFVTPSNALPAQSLSPAPEQAANQDVIAPSDDVCYKIRAYIFKRDDDHAPEFVRSTTCGPRKPHTKSIDAPQFKLVPAN